MRHVEVRALLPAADAGTAFDTLVDFPRYPTLVDVVRSVTIRSRPGETPMVSSWEVYFRNGILSWTEADHLRRDALRIDFETTEGDFEEFTGSWTLHQRGDAVEVVFAADFDFGVPSLASIVDPVAERVLTETIQLILGGLFPTSPALVGAHSGPAEHV
jgi:ribosome-associated toxin RatA of RatAB toxin-antitoxin module